MSFANWMQKSWLRGRSEEEEKVEREEKKRERNPS